MGPPIATTLTVLDIKAVTATNNGSSQSCQSDSGFSDRFRTYKKVKTKSLVFLHLQIHTVLESAQFENCILIVYIYPYERYRIKA